jgi:cell division protease FtsH
MNSNIKTFIIWFVLVCVAVLLWTVVKTGKAGSESQITFTHFMNQVDAGKVKSVTISGNEVHGKFTDENVGLHTFVPANYPASCVKRASTSRSKTPVPQTGSPS